MQSYGLNEDLNLENEVDYAYIPSFEDDPVADAQL